ncbi:hypothetical protein NEPAR06_1339 [Nematocida parisii]|nr:hypothetical protein NEPAR06_1339 [Nematocida parisii]KAI5156659.1 hypothetical protein NEPAR05_0726 [Nematocida parisii]
MKSRTEVLIMALLYIQAVIGTADKNESNGRGYKRKNERDLDCINNVYNAEREQGTSAQNVYQNSDLPNKVYLAENASAGMCILEALAKSLNKEEFNLPEIRRRNSAFIRKSEVNSYKTRNIDKANGIIYYLNYRCNKQLDVHSLERNCIFKNICKFKFRNVQNEIENTAVVNRSAEFIKHWSNENSKNIWLLIKDLGDSITERIFVIKEYLCNSSNTIGKKTNPGYYPDILKDIVEYSIKHGPYTYSYKEFTIFASAPGMHLNKKETLGDIWVKKRINMYYCLSSMIVMQQNACTSEDSDGELKIKLNHILCIPEIYEDMRIISNESVNHLIHLIKQNVLKVNTTENIQACDIIIMFSVISYLIGIAQKNTELVDMHFFIIKDKIFKGNSQNNSLPNVFNYVLFVMSKFYYYSSNLASVENDWRYSLSSLESMKHMALSSDGSHCLLGGSILSDKYYDFKAEVLEYTYVNNRFVVNNINLYFDVNSGQKFIPLSINYHYHVQFVDITKQTIEMVHLPFFIKSDENSSLLVCIHSIKDIVMYLHILYCKETRQPNKKCKAIYPFKFTHSTKTWSIINFTSEDMSKTIKQIESTGYNVVFYLIEENMSTAELIFAEFYNPDHADSAEQNIIHENIRMKMPNNTHEVFRIPTFLSPLLVSSIIFSGYSGYIPPNRFAKDQFYTDLIPIKLTQNTMKYNQNESALINENTEHAQESSKYTKYYYTDFIIRNSNDIYEDINCYLMNIEYTSVNNTSCTIKWTVKMSQNISEYTKYTFNSASIDHRNSTSKCIKPAIASFMDTVLRRHPSRDTINYGFCLYKTPCNADYKYSPIFCSTAADLFGILRNNPKLPLFFGNPRLEIPTCIKKQEILNSSDGIIFIKSSNYRMSNYGLHAEIIDILTQKFNSYL